ncbi:MAG: NlpC/P60 family protein [Clostridia bacterium]
MKFFKQIAVCAVTLVILLGLTVLTTSAEEVTYGIVTGSCVNIREQPSTSYQVLGQLYRGEKITVLERSDNWIKMKYNDIEGWMHGDYISVRAQEVTRSGGQVTRDTAASLASELLEYSKNFLGVPYKWAGTSPKTGFDCSGFTQYVFKHFEISINRIAADQALHGEKVSKQDLKPGDLVFFDTSGKVNGEITHVGIYLSDGKFIHASSPGDDVKYDDLTQGFYQRTYVTGRRIIQ